LKGILAFQEQQLKGIPVLITKSLYMFFTEKFLLDVQIKESFCSLSRIVRILPTTRNQLAQLSPTRALLKEIFGAVILSTCLLEPL
jgi:hypothetical protein